MSKERLLSLVTFLGIFLLSLQVVSDTDFGWHLRVGEYIVKTKSIPTQDLFSFSQPDYPYVYHSWASEVIVYLAYQAKGLFGVTILFSLILTSSLFFLYKAAQTLTAGKVVSLLFLWGAPVAHVVAGGRMRVFGLLFLSLLYFLFLKFRHDRSRLIWLLPLLFAFWANFHGSFILGIAVLLILTLASFLFSNDKVAQLTKTKTLSLVTFFSVLATLANPYLARAWQQAWLMSVSSYWAGVNLDWKPLVTSQNMGWLLALPLAGLIFTLFFSRLKVADWQKFILLLFFSLSLVSSRLVVALLVFFLPAANQVLLEIWLRVKKEIVDSLPVRLALSILLFTLSLMAVKNLLEINFAYSSTKNYYDFLKTKAAVRLPVDYAPPYQAGLFVQENLGDKRVLNSDKWGGFLIWQNPKGKVFYYGAMDNFFLNGRSFALEYLSMINASPDWEEKLDQYQIEAVFLPPDYPLVAVLKLKPEWRTVYQDSQAIILVKT